ncbi:MAG: carboxypeptidase-like regulatory domain-containing protein [Patescibacteria group bacterium]|nr:carboxypeptidase-like regulatory domain-containing protein [Patescibacteria group bacterium]
MKCKIILFIIIFFSFNMLATKRVLGESVVPNSTPQSSPSAKEEGEVKATVNLRASVPNSKDDYEISISSTPRREVLPGQEIEYTIFYGCSGGAATEEMTISVEWLLPEGEVAEFVSESASDAYGGAPPQINLETGSIVWEINDFPPGTTSRKVSFKLKAKDEFEKTGTFPIEVRARLVLPGFVVEDSHRVTVNFPEKRIEEAIPEIPATVWRYSQEFFAHPAFRVVFFRFLLVLLVFTLLFTPVILFLYFDLSLAFLPLLLQFIYHHFLIFFGWRERGRVWGRVFHTETKEPLFLVKVSAYNFSGDLLEETLTDRTGAFGFSLPEGRYLLEVTRPGYAVGSLEGKGIMLADNRFLFTWEVGREVRVFLQRKKILPSFWERFLEGFALQFSDFLLLLGLFLSFLNVFLSLSVSSVMVSTFYIFYLFTWTVVVYR